MVASRQDRKRRFKESLASLGRDPLTYLVIVGLLAQPVLLPALVYLFLCSFLLDPNGIFAFASIAFLSAVALFGHVQLFRQVFHYKKVRALGGHVVLKHRAHLLASLALGFLIAPAVSLVLWNSIHPTHSTSVSGVSRPVSREAQLVGLIHGIEQAGVWKLNKSN